MVTGLIFAKVFSLDNKQYKKPPLLYGIRRGISVTGLQNIEKEV